MRVRTWSLAIATALGCAGVLTVYLLILANQGNSPVAWAVAILVVGAVLPLVGAAVPRARAGCFFVPAVLLTLLSVLAGFSIGLLLLPFAIVAWLGFVLGPQPRATRSH